MGGEAALFIKTRVFLRRFSPASRYGRHPESASRESAFYVAYVLFSKFWSPALNSACDSRWYLLALKLEMMSMSNMWESPTFHTPLFPAS